MKWSQKSVNGLKPICKYSSRRTSSRVVTPTVAGSITIYSPRHIPIPYPSATPALGLEFCHPDRGLMLKPAHDLVSVGVRGNQGSAGGRIIQAGIPCRPAGPGWRPGRRGAGGLDPGARWGESARLGGRGDPGPAGRRRARSPADGCRHRAGVRPAHSGKSLRVAGSPARVRMPLSPHR